MTIQTAETSPRRKARIAGVLYLIVILAAAFAEAFVRGRLIVRSDAAATAANILAHQSLYRAGGAADLLNFACDIALAFIFYELLKPVSRSLALPMAAFRVMGDAMGAVITLLHFAPLALLGNAQYLSVFGPGQPQAQALALLRLHAQGYNVAMVFFGVHCVLLGYLVYRSTFWPRIIGALLAIAGLCYVTNSYARFLSPAFAAHLFPYILWPGLLAEVSLTLWLLIAGVNQEKWIARAGVARGDRGSDRALSVLQR